MVRRRTRTTAAVGGIATALATGSANIRMRRRSRAAAQFQAPDLDIVVDGVRERTFDVVARGGLRLRARRYTPADGVVRGRVVLAHGWAMNASFWDAAAHRLAAEADVEVVTWDQRGHGASDCPDDDGFALSHLGHDLDAVITTIHRDGLPLVVGGHSMGGMTVIQWLGHVRSGRCTSPEPDAVLLANTAVHDLVRDALSGIARTQSPRVLDLLERLLTTPAPIPSGAVIRPVVAALAHGLDPAEGSVAHTHALFAGCPPVVRAGFGRQLATVDLRACVDAISAPTIVVTGGRDLLTPPRHGAELARAIAGRTGDVRHVHVEDSGHQTPIERPDLVSGLLDELVERVAPRVVPLGEAAPTRWVPSLQDTRSATA